MTNHSRLPNEAINLAFGCMYWEDKYNDVYYKTFIEHWGGLDLAHMRRAFEEGEGEEKLLAMFALGLTATPEMADLLAPFLSSMSRMERWVSAICLGFMQDVRAFPVLESLLLDGLDLEEYTQRYQEETAERAHEQNWYAAYRWHAIQLLDNWDSPSLITILKQTFLALWHIQQRMLPYWWMEVSNYDALAYALGRRGDFALFESLELPAIFHNPAQIYMMLGYLHAQASSGGELTGLPSEISGLLSEMITNDSLQQAVAAQLGLHFGLSAKEQEAWIDEFYANSKARYKYGYVATDENEEDDEPEA